MMTYGESKNDELNKTVLNMLKNRIYLLERENNKTKKFNNAQMVEKIRQLIERMVENDN